MARTNAERWLADLVAGSGLSIGRVKTQHLGAAWYAVTFTTLDMTREVPGNVLRYYPDHDLLIGWNEQHRFPVEKTSALTRYAYLGPSETPWDVQHAWHVPLRVR